MSHLRSIHQRTENDAKTRGYYLNTDRKFLDSLLKGLKKNEERYGYPSCPCRLATGDFNLDRDIICPCDYRDIDVDEYGFCYCALYVREDVYRGKTEVSSIPERRPLEKINQVITEEGDTHKRTREKKRSHIEVSEHFSGKLKMWYCRQCGYISFREEPPYICPICKAKKEFFSEIRIAMI
jgi:ferredoxin-thioredoxin reductase catalytic subunit